MPSERSETKYGGMLEGHDWSDDEESDESDAEPVIEVTRHTITVDDRRDAHGYEYGLEWTFTIEAGVVKGYYRGHWLEGRTQSDPMQSPAWDDVPEAVKVAVKRELGVEAAGSIPTDLPDFYGEEP